MENHNNPRAVAEIMENAMLEFSEAMAHREQLSIRIGRRTTQIIRFGMAGLSILGFALFYLIFILTKDFSTITDHMERMSGNMYSIETVGQMSGNMNQMAEPMKMFPFP